MFVQMCGNGKPIGASTDDGDIDHIIILAAASLLLCFHFFCSNYTEGFFRRALRHIRVSTMTRMEDGWIDIALGVIWGWPQRMSALVVQVQLKTCDTR